MRKYSSEIKLNTNLYLSRDCMCSNIQYIHCNIIITILTSLFTMSGTPLESM